MPDCTEPIPLENLDFCPTDETIAGVSEVGVYGATISDFATIAKPPELSAATSLEDAGTITEAHTFKAGRGFHKIYFLPDTGMVDSQKVGEKGNSSWTNTLTGSLPGTGARVSGYLRKYQNVPMIFVVKEKDGNVKQIGSELCPAYLTEGTPTSGAKPGDLKNTPIKFQDTQVQPAPEYAGTIEEFTPPV